MERCTQKYSFKFNFKKALIQRNPIWQSTGSQISQNDYNYDYDYFSSPNTLSLPLFGVHAGNYICIYIYMIVEVGHTFPDKKMNNVVEACSHHLVQSLASKCHTDRSVRHKRMACWFNLSLCKYSLPVLVMFAATAANTQVV